LSISTENFDVGEVQFPKRAERKKKKARKNTTTIRRG